MTDLTGDDAYSQAVQTRITEFKATIATHETEPEPPQQWLVDHIIEERTVGWLIGKPNNGKSFVAVHLAGCIATGMSFAGQIVRKQPVLYVAAERYRSVRRRIKAWETHHGLLAEKLFVMRCQPRTTPDISRAADVDALIGIAHEVGAGLIIIDTQARVAPGIDENNYSDMQQLATAVDRLSSETQSAVLIVHHTTKAGNTPRGHSVIEGAADYILIAEREKRAPRHVIVDDFKQADTEKTTDRRFAIIPAGDAAALQSVEKPTVTLPASVIDLFKTSSNTASASAIANALQVSPNTAKHKLRTWEQAGLVHSNNKQGKAHRWLSSDYSFTYDDGSP